MKIYQERPRNFVKNFFFSLFLHEKDILPFAFFSQKREICFVFFFTLTVHVHLKPCSLISDRAKRASE